MMKKRIRVSTTSRMLLLAISMLLAFIAWWLIAKLGNYPAYMLPPPGLVIQRFWQVIENGVLLRNTLHTLAEVLAGLSLGVITATMLGYLLAKFVAIERLLSPYIVASQAVPIVAIAPLLVIWFGPGMFSKILICALIVFFPVLVNTVVGLRSVPEDLRDLMRSLLATRWQTFRLLELPAALPIFLGGLQIGATLAVIGAVVGEFVGSNSGLGFMINRARGQFDTALVFVTLLTLVFLALVLYGLVVWMQNRLLRWRQVPDEPILLK